MKVNDSDSASARPPRRTQSERNAATRSALLAAARTLFADKPFADVSTQAIVEAAGVTRGALYHQFDDKTALFAEVVEQIESETISAAMTTALARPEAADPIELIRLGARAWLDQCCDPAIHQILLVEAPSVLGWDRWREIGAKHGLGVIESMLSGAIDAGAMPAQPVRATAHVLLGALDEAALYVSRAPDRSVAVAQMYEVTDRLIGALTAR